MKAWWFEPDNGRLGYGDGRQPRKGVTHRVSRNLPLGLCHYGLHASKLPLDALKYAHSSNPWRVELGGEVLHGDDKMCASERTYLARVPNSEAVLRKFARLCALDVVHLWDAPDVVIRWLRTGDESQRDAAYCAAYCAAHSAARSGASSAARYAARSGASSAASSAASSGASSAAESAACYAASSEAYSATSYEAYSAALYAARDAALRQQNTRLHRMLLQAIREGR